MELIDEKKAGMIDGQGSVILHVAHSPHISNEGSTTKRLMIDVIIALLPVVGVAVYIFKWYVIQQLLICLASCLTFESIFTALRGRSSTLVDFSAIVTGVILALSLPAGAPWYVGVIASGTAIGFGKALFGGLGMNLFNPAMVGRAFVMISFAGVMASSGFVVESSSVDIMSMATPLNAFKQNGMLTPVSDLFWGVSNGCPGETSAFACLIGGTYLCLRRTASWEIPAGIFTMVLAIGTSMDLLHAGNGIFEIDFWISGTTTHWTVFHHLMSGSLMFGAFFISTDPVTSPLAPLGKFILGLGTGALIMLLRFFSGYPEGVMFAVLLMNALTPLINRATRPKTMGEF